MKPAARYSLEGLDAQWPITEVLLLRRPRPPPPQPVAADERDAGGSVTIESLQRPGNSIVSGRWRGGQCSQRDVITHYDELITVARLVLSVRVGPVTLRTPFARL